MQFEEAFDWEIPTKTPRDKDREDAVEYIEKHEKTTRAEGRK